MNTTEDRFVASYAAAPPPSRASFAEYLSLGCLALQVLAFLIGALGLMFDPSVDQEWGGLGYLLLMALAPVIVAPLGMLLGLLAAAGTRWRSRPGVAGFILNTGVLLLWFAWRSSN